jgi:hypothetical protein
MITRWAVSEAFPEANGITNLSHVTDIDGDKNTVYARISIHSDDDQVHEFRFGYSDQFGTQCRHHALRWSVKFSLAHQDG